MDQLTESKFDYNQLQPEIADFLKDKETNMKEIVGSAYTRIGKELKDAQDRLSQNGYGCFQDWYESLGFKRSTVYKMIKRYDLILQNVEKQDLIEDLPLSLTYEIAKKSADPELKQQVLDGDITSHKKYKELKKEKDSLQKEKDNLQSKVEEQRRLKKQAYNEMKEIEKRNPEVIEKTKEVVPEEIQNKIKNLKERVGDLDKHKSEVNNYQKKKNKLDKEIAELHEYKRKLEEENNQIAKQAEVVQGLRSKVNKIINEKGGIEQLLKKDVEMRKVDLYNINEMADTLTEIAELIYDYVNEQSNKKEGEVIDV